MNSKVPPKLNHSMILRFWEMQNFLLLLVEEQLSGDAPLQPTANSPSGQV